MSTYLNPMNKQKNYDIIIVGGGPAGLSSAIEASKRNCKVALFERSKEIGYPIHTSGGSWVDELQKLGTPTKFMHLIKYGEFIGTKNKVKFEYKKAPSCILDVRGFYQFLAEKATMMGTDIYINTKVTGPIISENYIKGVNILSNGNKYKFRSNIVIDASGFNAVIAKKIGLLDKFKIYGIGAEYDLVSPTWIQDKVAFIMNKYTPAGYGWIFPHGNSRVSVGICIIKPFSKKSPVKCLEHFLLSNDEIIRDLEPLKKIEFHEGFIPNSGILPKTISNGLLIVGDAAGHVSGIAGEGIRYAMDIGNIAGTVAADAIMRKRFDERFLVNHEKQWRKKYEFKFKVMYEINKRLRTYSYEKWDKSLEKLSLLTPELLVDYLKGNFTTNFLFNIFKNQPKLASSAIFRLIKRSISKND